MTYEGLFKKCHTVGECRRMKVTQLDKATSDISRWEIEKCYEKRRNEITKKEAKG